MESPLLRLPGELRNRIWKYALGDFEIQLSHYKTKGGAEFLEVHVPRQHPLALTASCHQIHCETKLLPTALNKFRGDAESLPLFFDSDRLDDARLRSITTVCIIKLCRPIQFDINLEPHMRIHRRGQRIFENMIHSLKRLAGVGQSTIEYRVNQERYEQIVQMVPSLLSQSQDLVAQKMGRRRIQVNILVTQAFE
jgi:hypothetical protein